MATPTDRGAEDALLRLIARHGTPKAHSKYGVGGCITCCACPCWQYAEQALRDLRAAGYDVVRVMADA